MIDFFFKYELLIVPSFVWIGIQLFKLIYDRVETKKWHLSRFFFGFGGMPSSHTAIIISLTTLIGKKYGIDSPFFAISTILALIVMADAAGVRRNVGEQAKAINKIIQDEEKNGFKNLQEMTGHTPFQVLVGAVIGFVCGLIF